MSATRRTGAAVDALEAHPEDWLIVAGDAGDTPAQLEWVLRTLTPRFKQLVWVPGNHDLWTPRSLAAAQRGVAHYERLVALCRRHGVLTPEDAYARWPGDGPPRAIVPTFLLYDYSFAPDGVTAEHAVAWAAESACAPPTKIFWRPIRIATRRLVRTQRVAAPGPGWRHCRRTCG